MAADEVLTMKEIRDRLQVNQVHGLQARQGAATG
jgi:hypothetical protein